MSAVIIRSPLNTLRYVPIAGAGEWHVRDERAEGGGGSKGGAGQGQVRGHGLVTGVITSNADTLPSVHLPLSSRPQASAPPLRITSSAPPLWIRRKRPDGLSAMFV